MTRIALAVLLAVPPTTDLEIVKRAAGGEAWK